MENPPASSTVQLNRTLIGAISGLLFLMAGGLSVTVGAQNVWTGACLKVGLVMGAVWLALPALMKRTHFGEASPGLIVGVVSLALFLTGKRVDFRIVLAILFGAGVATVFLRPRSGSRSR